ncbi:MAG: hypothetical protein J0I84_19185 [Terrimonas sp.]|nr:hypothetical protein [Terrimonas sp.]
MTHHSLTIHRDGANTTANRTRKAMEFIFVSVSAKEDKDAKEQYEKQLH